MKSVFDRFQQYWKNQHSSMEDGLPNEHIRPLHSIQIPLLIGVIGYVHAFALRKIVTQKARIDVDAPPLPCECGTPKYMGIPCWHILWERIHGGGIVLLSDIHPHWHYNRESTAELAIGRQVIPLLNPDVVKGKGRPKGALGRKNIFIPGRGVEATAEVAAALQPRPARWRGRSHQRGRGTSSTRRHPSAFEIDPYEFTSTAPARLSTTSTASAKLSKRSAPEDNDENETQDCITVDMDILPGAQELVDVSLAEITAGRPPLTLSTTQVALGRGAGSARDTYIPGTVRERAYMRAKSTVVERDMEDDTLDELASKDPVFRVDFDLLYAPFYCTSSPATLHQEYGRLVSFATTTTRKKIL
jgi:hypothetical protein